MIDNYEKDVVQHVRSSFAELMIQAIQFPDDESIWKLKIAQCEALPPIGSDEPYEAYISKLIQSGILTFERLQ